MFNRIPPEHLDPLREDFDSIISGYVALTDIFYSQNKPLFKDLLQRCPITKELRLRISDSTPERTIYSTPNYVMRSVDRIEKDLLMVKLGDVEKNLSHFKRQINTMPTRRLEAKRLNTLAGSAILTFAKRFGNMLGSGEGIRTDLRRRAIISALKVVDFTQLDKFFAGKIEDYAHHNPSLDKSLTNFFVQLLFGDHSKLQKVVTTFKPTLQSVVTIERHPDTHVPSKLSFEKMELAEKLQTIWRSCARRKKRPEHLVLKLTPAIADSFNRNLKVRKGLDLDTIIFRVNGYDILPFSIVLGAWFDLKQVRSRVRRIQDLTRFAHWGRDLESKTSKAVELLEHFFPERKTRPKKGEPRHLEEVLIILPFNLTETSLDIVADSVTGTDTPLTNTLHIFCDVREKEAVNKFSTPLWAKRLDIEIRFS